MPSRTVLFASGLAVTIVLGFTACGSSDTSTASSTTASTTSTSTTTTEAEDGTTSTTTIGGSESDSSTTVDIGAAGGGSVTIVTKPEADGKEQTIVMGFGTSDGDCNLDAATNTAEVDVETADQSFVLRYDPAEPTAADIKFTDTISSKSENISFYVDEDTEGSSIDNIQITTGRAAITAQISNTYAAFPATITVSCP